MFGHRSPPTDEMLLLSVCHNNFKTDFGSRTNLSPPIPRLERRRLAVKNQFPGALRVGFNAAVAMQHDFVAKSLIKF